MTDQFSFEPIAFVSSPIKSQTDVGWGGTVSTIKVEPRYQQGLTGLEQFSHVVVVTVLHLAAFNADAHLQRRPRGIESLPRLGIFAQRAKNRPNPIGVTAVRLLDVSETELQVQGLDAIDGTPVLDIKPYVPDFDCVPDPEVPDWVDEIMKDYF